MMELILAIITLILCIGMIIFIIGGGIWCRNSEKKKWNNGYCSACNTRWEHRDTDSQGGRMYVCSCEQRHSCWISYKVDKNI